MLKIIELLDKLAFDRNNNSKLAFSKNNNNKLISKRNNGNNKIDRYDIDRNDIKHANNLRNLSKLGKSKNKKISKSQNLANLEKN